MLASIVIALTVVASEPVTFAELHYAMAESVGANADAAYEDAIELQEQLSYEAAAGRADKCPTDTSWVRQVAGGWVAECGDANGELVSEYGSNGMRVR